MQTRQSPSPHQMTSKSTQKLPTKQQTNAKPKFTKIGKREKKRRKKKRKENHHKGMHQRGGTHHSHSPGTIADPAKRHRCRDKSTESKTKEANNPHQWEKSPEGSNRRDWTMSQREGRTAHSNKNHRDPKQHQDAASKTDPRPDTKEEERRGIIQTHHITDVNRLTGIDRSKQISQENNARNTKGSDRQTTREPTRELAPIRARIDRRRGGASDEMAAPTITQTPRAIRTGPVSYRRLYWELPRRLQ